MLLSTEPLPPGGMHLQIPTYEFLTFMKRTYICNMSPERLLVPRYLLVSSVQERQHQGSSQIQSEIGSRSMNAKHVRSKGQWETRLTL